MGPVNRPGIVIIGSVGVRLVCRNKKDFARRNGKSASINFGPTFPSDAKNQNGFIKPVRSAYPMQIGFGIPSKAFDMQTHTERMATDMTEQIGGQEMNDLATKSLCLGFHGRQDSPSFWEVRPLSFS
jgi:hypothetical protein